MNRSRCLSMAQNLLARSKLSGWCPRRRSALQIFNKFLHLFALKYSEVEMLQWLQNGRALMAAH